MQLAMIGAGYVGLTTSACLAELGHSITCFDADEDRVASIARGGIPFYEPGLDELVGRQMEAGRLRCSSAIEAEIGAADAVFIAVGTPSAANGDTDLSYIEGAARRIARSVSPGAVIVIKSTVPPGTSRLVREIIAQERGALDFTIASNPEFLREGCAIRDFLEPDRIVIGTDDPHAAALLQRVYAPLTESGIALVCTSTSNAELIKYSANAFLALKIGFINEIANLCENVGGDIDHVARGIGLDKRIGPSFLATGPGFGGSCFPKDTRALAAMGRRHGAPQALVETLIRRNEERKVALAERVLAEARTYGRKATVAILGLAFKANTDDVREAASLAIIPILQRAGLRIRAHDPQANKSAALHFKGVEFSDTPYAAIEGADVAVVLTEWDCFQALDLRKVAALMSGASLMDFRGIFRPEAVTAHNLRYIGLGRSSAVPAQKRQQDALDMQPAAIPA
jgi:UDPglucose 6-dehydrogenase